MDYHLSLYFLKNLYKIIDFTELSIILISQLEHLMYCDFTIYSVDLLLINYYLIINTYYILRTS